MKMNKTRAKDLFQYSGDFTILNTLSYKDEDSHDYGWQKLGFNLKISDSGCYTKHEMINFERISSPAKSLLENWFPKQHATVNNLLDAMEKVDYGVWEKLKERAIKRGLYAAEDKNKKKEGGTLECVVCFDNTINMLLLPCMHIVLCQECSDKCVICPLCRKVIVSKTKVYMG